MSGFTYEFTEKNERLETYEWDNVWWDQAPDPNLARVLYIGDSISCATRRIATATAEGAFVFDGVGTSKAVDNPYFYDTVRMFTKQEPSRAAVLFNNGLHGWHLDDETAYREHYEKMIGFLLEHFSSTPIMLVLTTTVADAERDSRVVTRNRVVMELAEKYGLPTVDLYSVTAANKELLSEDGVHFKPDGYREIAKTLVSHVCEVIKK